MFPVRYNNSTTEYTAQLERKSDYFTWFVNLLSELNAFLINILWNKGKIMYLLWYRHWLHSKSNSQISFLNRFLMNDSK